MDGFKSLRFLLLAGFLSLLTACSTVNPCTSSATSTDGDITERIQMVYHGDRGLNDQDLYVRTFERTVTLSGTVENMTQAGIAIDIARRMPGVRCVISRIQLRCCKQYSEFIGRSSTAFKCGA